ncbi:MULTISPECIES: ABC transporter permease [unclassified Mesorhizobium]|uniref:ABC transporter permease n=1 Tax=unclassified Mesorhizobium TaxID=325217 RepID=UPI002414DF23|nr:MULTISPECIES: ABC transporter permease [unclassified Mesorhizobium]MDG4889971.1 ABC transporter permease [Mesorhizobium sp. WSM4887]MDG4904113.1 ABC transporter permease [Mesorhizobium sp. WSM4962]MDG4909140.1 ABC transporter permease [Mesorhizobium sp. WSM4898]MDG4921764.1 ABC transporter permease [Mesorhizobium sp. WSM4989]
MQAVAVRKENTIIFGLVALAAIVLLGYMYMNAPAFFRVNNLVNVLVQTSVLGLLAMGMSFVLIGGGIDLSLPAILAFSAIIGVIAMQTTQVAMLGPIMMLAIGAALGAFNGAAVAYFGMAPFVVTLATMTVVGGASVWITGSQSVSGYPPVFDDVIRFRLLNLPMLVWITAVITAVATAIIAKGAYGRQIKAVGLNPRAALIARMDVKRLVLSTYVLSGCFAAITGVFLVARLGSASANLGNDSLLLDIISACVIGRVSIYGGIGNPLHAVLGALFVTLISNSMNQLGASYFASLILKGVLIIIFVYLDQALRRKA